MIAVAVQEVFFVGNLKLLFFIQKFFRITRFIFSVNYLPEWALSLVCEVLSDVC